MDRRFDKWQMGLAYEAGFFLGGVQVMDDLFRDGACGMQKYRDCVLKLCASVAPEMTAEDAGTLLLPHLDDPARGWVEEFYLRRAGMS